MDKLANKLKSRSNRQFSSVERNNCENYWKEISEFFLNNQYNDTSSNVSDIIITNPGAKRTRQLYDSTALQATQDLAATFQGTLTNSATIWSKQRFLNESLNNDEQSVNWLENSNRILHTKFNESNFDSEIGKFYQSLVALANAAMFFEEDEDGFLFTTLHMSQVAWEQSHKGVVDRVYRKLSLTAEQAIDKFGAGALDKNILRAEKDSPDKEFPFLHAIYPRPKKEVKLNSVGLAPDVNRPIASVYVDLTHCKVVEETGYYEMPILVARWGMMPGEVYGRGPAHLSLPDVRTLNRLKHRGMQAIDKAVSPALLVNQRDVFGDLDLRPNSINVVGNHQGIREMPTAARVDILQFSEENLKASIRSIFFLDKLLLPPRDTVGEMTAYEISARIEQMHRVTGPVLSRLSFELLGPLNVRGFKILLRNGSLPELPEALKQFGIDLEIVYVNPLARAQQIQDVSNIQQWIQNLAMTAQLIPSVMDNIDADGIARHTAKVLGVPEIAVKNVEQVIQERQARAQQEAAQQQLQMGIGLADINSKINLGQK